MPAKVSILVPVYNVARYIDTCIKSIIKQTYKDWELILIEDGSTDNSYEIAQKWAASNEKISLIKHDENKGIEVTRYTGLNNANGEYVMFVDSDDWIHKDALRKLVLKMEEEQADIVFGSATRVLKGPIRTKPKNTYWGIADKSITQPLLFDEYYMSYFGENRLLVTMWGKLYRMDAIKKADIKPLGFSMGEDLLFNIRLHPHLSKVSFIKDLVYYYRYGGMTTKSNPSFLADIKKQFNIKKELIKKYNYHQAIPFIEIELYNCLYSYLTSRFLIDKSTMEKVESIIQTEMEDPIYETCTHAINISERNKAVANKDVRLIAETAFAEALSQKKIYTIKRLLSKLTLWA